MNDKQAPALATQQKALTQYLDSLLMEIPGEAVSDAPAAIEQNANPVQEVEVGSQSPEIATQERHYPEAVMGGGEIPAWGTSPFKALFFNVGEITLAAPLEKLGGVLTQCDEITVMPGNAARYLGVMVHRGNPIRILDFENLIAELSGESSALKGSERAAPKHVILIEGAGTGIACRDVAEVEQILPDDVRWRTGTTKHPWYRGIVIEKMCALLDIDVLLSILNTEHGRKTAP